MKFRKLIQLVTISFVTITIFACSNAPKMMTQPMPQSGFLPNYSLLQTVPNTPDGTRVWRYRNEAVNPSAYRAVLLDPIFLNQTPTQNITAESLIQAKITLQDSMVQAVISKGNMQIVTKPGPGVVRISVGITGAEASANSLQPWNFTPIGLAANAAAYAAGVNAKTPALVIENKITDSQSNQLLGEGLIIVEGESFRTASASVDSFVEMAKKAVAASLKLSTQQ
ncbi:MAG: DUF3313 domain-containing protein [Betaproteobacteria bacterium]|nr:DUF3313 domain-containing protein [Betaproteobacteria bacterium]